MQTGRDLPSRQGPRRTLERMVKIWCSSFRSKHHRPFKDVSTRLFSTKNSSIAQGPLQTRLHLRSLLARLPTNVLLQFDTFCGFIHYKTATLNQLSGTNPPPSSRPRSASAV